MDINTDSCYYDVFFSRYFEDEYDYQAAIQAVKYVVAIAQTSVFQRLGATFYTERYPACSSFVPLSEEYIECMVQSYTSTIFHPVGTNR